jgi:hypothetical protein
MVGVIVIGVIAGVIAATVFAVIPWAQDQAASQSIDAVVTAESVAFAFDDDGVQQYLSEVALGTGGAGGESLLTASGKLVIVLGAGGTTYTAYSLSSTGKVFATTSASPTVRTEYASIAAANTAIGALVGALSAPSDVLTFTPAP